MKRRIVPALLTAAFLLIMTILPVSASLSRVPLAMVSSGNLILNPDAEAGGPGTPTCDVVAVPNWTTASNFTALKYGCNGEEPDADTPGPVNRGFNYFAGGPDNASSSATQMIDLSSFASAIDTGNQTFTLSGYLGGWSFQADNSTLTIKFKNIIDVVLGTTTIGPVTNVERGNQTALYYRTVNGLVPIGSRKVEVTLQMTRYEGAFNDGYADNLFLGLGSTSGGNISGKVYNDSVAVANEVAGAAIEACQSGGGCQTTSSSSDGSYMFINLTAGQYSLRAFPPGGNNRLSGMLGPLTVTGSTSLQNQHIVLLPPSGPPPGTDITKRGTAPGGIPSVYWREKLTLTTTGCIGGTASYSITQHGTEIISGNMDESPAGTYTAVINSLYPYHSGALVSITIICPGPSTTFIDFNIWIDPSGAVVNTIGEPISGATVTLYRSDSAPGPFEIVVSGTTTMSPSNRDNPDETDDSGYFGWDVIAGYYKVRAEKSGCVSAENHSKSYVETNVLTIPPPVTDLRLVLYCGEKYQIYLPITVR